MKRKTAAAAVYASAIIMFAVFLASALAPPVMGGLSVEGTDRHDVSTDGKNINVEWGVAIESSLPYRINDVNISVKVGGGRGITIAEAGFDVKNGTTTKNLSGKLPTITALLLATGGDSKKGVYVPLDFEIRGS
ncbi:MAG: hypothetical protein LBT41_04495, partial [Candidatus Methanoplasma sp.]|nr:hypothetical protein [Candidatus Methanoplasma sp.]